MAVLSTVATPLNLDIQTLTYIAASATLLFIVYASLRRARKPASYFEIPLIFKELNVKARAQKWRSDCGEVTRLGHQLFRKGHISMYRATEEDGSETVIVNDRYLNELKALPDGVLNSDAALNPDMLTHYTHVGVIGPIGQKTVRSDLTPGLPRLMPAIADEAVAALSNCFPQEADNWVPLHVFQAVLNSVAQVSARLFVGSRLCRDPRWLKCSQTATISAFATMYALKPWPAWLRPFAQYTQPDKQALEAARAEAIAILEEEAKTRQLNNDEDEDRDTLFHWVAAKNPQWATDYAAQADLQLELSVAAIHTTTMAVTHMLYDLATYPEYITILREEIQAALKVTGGVYNRDCIAKMAKTESFMKESQRLHPVAFTTFKRAALKDFTLSDGTMFPKGITIQVDSTARYRDPELWENPDQFDGSRFLRLAENDKQKGRHQFVAASTDYVFWGIGKHACPGRFFAANEIKTILAMIILRYDVSLKHGEERPKDVYSGRFINPDPTAEILIRKAQGRS